MSGLQKRYKIILLICIGIVLFIIIYTYMYNSNFVKANLEDIEEIYINYYSYEESLQPIITFKLNEEEKNIILNSLNNLKLKKNVSGGNGGNYEVVLNENTKFSFNYNSKIGQSSWFDQKIETPVKWVGQEYYGNTMLPVITLMRVIDMVDIRLTERVEIFQTTKIIIQKNDNSIELNNIERENIIKQLKDFVEIEDELIKGELEYTIDFNNGTKLQVYNNIESNTNEKKKYGIIITENGTSKNIQVPQLMFNYMSSILPNE